MSIIIYANIWVLFLILTHTHTHMMILAHPTAWMNLGNMLVSEVSRHESADSVLSPHLCEDPRTRRHTEMEEQRFPGLEQESNQEFLFLGTMFLFEMVAF